MRISKVKIKIYLDRKGVVNKVWGNFFKKVNEKYPDLCKKCSRCCCSECGDMRGYFSELVYQHTFGKPRPNKKSFLTKKGCSLPYEKRSSICVGHLCRVMEEKIIESCDAYSLLRSSMALYKHLFADYNYNTEDRTMECAITASKVSDDTIQYLIDTINLMTQKL